MSSQILDILITGTSRGIGYETALNLSGKQGVRVFALSRNAQKLKQLCERAGTEYPGAIIVPIEFDLENGNLEEVAERIGSVSGKLDGLINNAANILVKPFEQLEEADFKRIYHLNVFRTAMLIRTLIPLMKRETGKPFSHIVNISSMGGFQGSVKFPGLSAYSSSKAALCGLTESLGVELKAYGIAANCLCLGAVQTEMLREAFPGYEAPVGPAEMGAFIGDFSLNGARYFNGQIIPVSLSTP